MVGLIAYSTKSGLGYQTRGIYKHLKPNKTLLIDLSEYNRMATHHHEFPGARIVNGYPKMEDIEWLCDGVNKIFVCETPLNYDLYRVAKDRGVRIIQQYNYEFLDYFRHPHLPRPDVLAAPTSWNIERVKNLNIAPVQELRVPIDRDLIPFRNIEKCTTFVHIIGRPAVYDRNGTEAFIKAAEDLGNKYKYVIYMQKPTDYRTNGNFRHLSELIKTSRIRFQLIEDVENNADMYNHDGVLVLPRRYGGLCLPMLEALSAGMPVIMTDISPNRDMLPEYWLVPAEHKGNFIAHVQVDLYTASHSHLVEKMKQFTDPMIIKTANKMANVIAAMNSWALLINKYECI